MTEVQLLLDKYKNGRISQEELLRFQEIIAGNDYEPEIKADILSALYNNRTPQSGWTEEDGEAVLQLSLIHI